jgi:branched-chain amino acid transport system ATP-binding protein
MLEVESVSVSYGAVQVLWDVSFKVNQNEIVSIIGPNGAGKTTLVKTIIGLIHPMKGRILFRGEPIETMPPYEIVKKGMSLIPGERKIFPRMTVKENLLIGAYPVRDGETIHKLVERAHQIFPVLEKKSNDLARTLSGGEQQMLVISRGLMSNPALLIIDEPSLGLAPILVEKMLDTVCRINEEGVTILLVEQNIQESLEVADRGYVLEEGKIVITGKGKELLSNEHIKEAYLGI